MPFLALHAQVLRAAWDNIRTSFWFVPVLMACAGLVLAALGPALDRLMTGHLLAYRIGREDALQGLSTILTSMFTMTSLVFSITVVVLTLGASQFGPRLIRNFMARKLTQIVLGTYVMTIVFCLLLLARLGRGEGAQAAAPFTLPLAFGLTLASVILLIFHIHLLARSMQSETIIGLVGTELDDGISQLETSGDDREETGNLLPEGFEKNARYIGVPRQGYVQTIEFDALTDVAHRAGLLVVFDFRPGDYVIVGGRQIGLYPASAVTPQVEQQILRTVTLGDNRTPVQDLEFSIRHLVEIAVRALSPGINDPYTATAVIDRLSGSLSRLMAARMPAGLFRDTAGEVRVICERPTHASLIGSAFDQIRQSGSDKPLVLIHMAQAIGRLAEAAPTPELVSVLGGELGLIRETAMRCVGRAADRDAVTKRIAAAQSALHAAGRRLSG
ncbi:MAG: DUF2254 domain-containing protein [Pararhodobacter sp.]